MTFKDAYLKILAENRLTQESGSRAIGLTSRKELWRLLQGDFKIATMYRLLSPFGFRLQITNGETTYTILPAIKEDNGKRVGNPTFLKK